MKINFRKLAQSIEINQKEKIDCIRWDEIQLWFIFDIHSIFVIFKCQNSPHKSAIQTEMKAKRKKIKIQWNHCPWNTFYAASGEQGGKNLQVWPNELFFR